MLAPSRHADAVDYTGAMLCELPAGWVTTTLGNLVGIVRGVTYKKMDARSESEQGLVPILRATNIGQALSFQDLVYVPDKYVKYEQMLRLGDIVIAASSGSRAVVGKAAQLRHDWTGSFGAFCFALRPDRGLIKEYIAWFLQTQEYRTRVSELSAGVNINNLKREHIEETTIPLPPITEQRRIVAEIEKQFTRLDASVAALKRVQANLERYRASVLKAACEGALVPTEAELARAESRDYEPADRLLRRILAERRAPLGGPGEAAGQVQRARRAGHGRPARVIGGVGVEWTRPIDNDSQERILQTTPREVGDSDIEDKCRPCDVGKSTRHSLGE